jgi:tRNA (cytidine/uridine-2'-O-)-methyltransferase
MFNIVLFNPQIPPNTGNIIRLCSNTNSKIHLIKPLGFSINMKSMRRAGLDYIKNVQVKTYKDIDDFLIKTDFKTTHLVTKFGDINYTKVNYKKGDCFIFGSEISGLSEEVYKKLSKSKKIFIPMIPENRSINLANAVAICIFEAWRQNNFLLS